MFESALQAKLLTDNTLLSYLNTYNGKPSIFSELAPENAKLPYIVYRINRRSNEDAAIQRFTIMVDYFAYDKSAVNSRNASERIELLLDRAELSHDRYSNIRIFFFAGSSIPEEDPRSIHYNLQFEARAGRKNFIDENYTT